jgi:deoxyribodipyrimidine photo-lyase
MSAAIWWVRRDLRLGDNHALTAAVRQSGPHVIPIFILDPALINSNYVGEKRLSFLLAGLRKLDQELNKIGGRLIIRKGSPELALHQVFEQTGAQMIYAQDDHSPYADQRDAKVTRNLPLKLVGTPAVYPPGTVMKAEGKPYQVYTPFSKRWKSISDLSLSDILPAPKKLTTPDNIHSLEIKTDPGSADKQLFPPGEMEGQRRLNTFILGEEAPIYCYEADRDRLDQNVTSSLSPYLRFGMVSARQAAKMAIEAIKRSPSAKNQKSAGKWLDEIIWRDFYIHILHFFPQVRKDNFRPYTIPWINNIDTFSTWREGRTGYPIVDAAMIQLSQTGWMHNRARMIVASFLTKNLLIDWRWGERWFMQQLVDGDPAANNGGWQWSAGTGTDAAPYFRIFNPSSQSKKYNPQGEFIRQWVPALANVPDKYIHEPWKMPSGIQGKAGCKIGIDYPKPIIEYAYSRERALQVYKSAITEN